ncbi:hypothetical protein [Allosphingosinicella sp.]|uniref:hypothetical protein n=1 Tax=Allosphingosinicella sp. TaxID=2823234 RepID=UPI003783D36C
MKTARLIFTIAGIYGLIVLAPFLFMERMIAERTPGGLTHPEYYYGFLGAGLVMQLVYLTIGRDPARFRPLMPLGTLAKLAFFIPVVILFLQHRVPSVTLGFASIDVVLGLAFLYAWRTTGDA